VNRVTVLLGYLNEEGEEDELTFELLVPRVPRIGESMDFEGPSSANVSVISIVVRNVVQSFYLMSHPVGGYASTSRTEVVADLVDVRIKRGDLMTVLRVHGAEINDGRRTS
jgi:hypothetical protein